MASLETNKIIESIRQQKRKRKMIKKILFTVSLLGLLTLKTSAQDFYDINAINVIEITFPQDNWDSMLDQLKSAGQEERLLGTVVVNKIQFDSVGVRYKGNSSYSTNRVKNPLNIKLDYIIKDQELDNYGTLKLANAYKDPSFVREALSYEIARKYMPASLANYAKVYINDNYMGLYTSVQDVDKHFLRSHFYGDENSFFKGELVGGGGPTSVKIWGYFGGDSSSYANYYELESDYGWGDLINLLDVLNNNPESVEDVLNIDRHLWMLAYDILFVNLDAPVNFAHNYYLYQDNAGRFNPIIWDLNENFGVFSRLLDGGSLSTSGMQRLDPYLNSSKSNYPIISKILSNSTYKKMYVAHMKTIMDDFLTNGLYKTRALEIQSIIDSEVQNDPNKFYTYSNFINNIDNSISTGGGRPGQNESSIGITQLMDARVSYLNSHADFQPVAPAIGQITVSPNQITSNSIVWISADVPDTANVYLAYRLSTIDKFEKIEMFDDGENNDGNVGDNIYGVSISVEQSDVQYYVYAENEDAVTFSPPRAEYEYYNLSVTGNLVINEFMADNEITVADESGEYDDWIELYNNGNQAMSLSGYFLSDDGNNLDKWAFPDTIIEANNYLIVWADKDDEQGCLHTNFKLSASGESIYLINSSDNVIDEINFSEQKSDMSFGRYPNGTGDFVEMNSSFALENLSTQTGIEDADSKQLHSFVLEQNYPNPFNSSTAITFSLPNENSVILKIFNTIGQVVATLVEGEQQAGNHILQWDADDFPSGVYYYVLTIGSQRDVKKMLLLR
jgi:spore coat protein CotH